jgi:hypothetical protein
MSRTVCAISQPTFLPWLGWFDLLDQVDVFVILDDVSYSKQSWQQRNRIRTANGLDYLTVPVKSAGKLGQVISECQLANTIFSRKLLGSIKANYAKAPFFGNIYPELASAMERGVATGRLLDLNCALIRWMAQQLGTKTPMVMASSLAVGGKRGEHVAGICESLGATEYISPVGAAPYLIEDKEAFDKRTIRILLQAFEHPEYRQCFSPFIPFASALDLLFNVGPGAIEIIRSGRRVPMPIENMKELV